MSMSRKLWASVGFAVVATLPAAGIAATAADDNTPALHRHDHGAAADGRIQVAAGESGEGGEAGEAGEAGDAFQSGDEQIALRGRLMLVRGHVRVGTELVAQNRLDEAMPHFHHPIEEIYPELKGPLTKAGVTGFKASLENGSRAVMAKAPKAKIDAAVAGIDKAVAGAVARIPARTRAAPSFIYGVIAGVMETAAGEYGEAVKDGKFVAVVEYQDGRGFILEARDYFEKNKAILAAKDAEATQRLADLFAQLTPVWPQAMPPATPVMSPGEVQALASRVELLKRRFD